MCMIWPLVICSYVHKLNMHYTQGTIYIYLQKYVLDDLYLSSQQHGWYMHLKYIIQTDFKKFVQFYKREEFLVDPYYEPLSRFMIHTV